MIMGDPLAGAIAVVRAMVFVSAVITILGLARVFVRWRSLEDRVLVICVHIFLLVCCAGLGCGLRERGAMDAVVGVACFIWVALCLATAYALSELRRRLHAFFRNKNSKNVLALMGTVAVAILGIVACMRLLLWIFT